MDREEIKKEAKKLYKEGQTLKEISEKYNVPQGTMRRWKHEGNWDGERSAKENERSAKKSGQQEKPDKALKKAIEEMCQNSELSEKQKLFCIYFVKSFNATKAYQKAYECSYASAAANACRLIEKDRVKKEIEKLKNARMNREMLTQDDIFQKYIDIAFADITDFVDIKEDTVQIKTEIDGSVVTEIKQGKEGMTVKLADRMKALAWLSDHMDLTTEEQKARIAVLKKQAWQESEDDETGIVEIAQILEDEDDDDMDASTKTD